MKKMFCAIAVILLVCSCSDTKREKDKPIWFSHEDPNLRDGYGEKNFPRDILSNPTNR